MMTFKNYFSMAKEKKLYAVKENAGRIWKTEINVNSIKEIRHEGAGCEMFIDEIVVEFTDYSTIVADKIVSE